MRKWKIVIKFIWNEASIETDTNISDTAASNSTVIATIIRGLKTFAAEASNGNKKTEQALLAAMANSISGNNTAKLETESYIRIWIDTEESAVHDLDIHIKSAPNNDGESTVAYYLAKSMFKYLQGIKDEEKRIKLVSKTLNIFSKLVEC